MPNTLTVAPHLGFEPVEHDYETGVVVMRCTKCAQQIKTTLIAIKLGKSGIEAHNRYKHQS
jgi:hypothetical protein